METFDSNQPACSQHIIGFIQASRTHDRTKALNIIEDLRHDIDRREPMGGTFLHHLACWDEWAAAFSDHLVANGADVNIRDREGKTPLIAAIEAGGDLNLISSLLDADADVSIADIERRTAAHYAARHPRAIAVAHLLKEAGASLVVSDRDGLTPIDLLFTNGVKVVELQSLVGVGPSWVLDDAEPTSCQPARRNRSYR